MKLKYSLIICKDDFIQPKYSMPIFYNGVVIGNYNIFLSKLNKTLNTIREDINTIISPSQYGIPNIIKESLKNSFDACKDNFLENEKFEGKINISILIDHILNSITIILKDNGAGKKATNTEGKKSNTSYIGGAGKGLNPLSEKSNSSFSLKLYSNGAKFELQDTFK